MLDTIDRIHITLDGAAVPAPGAPALIVDGRADEFVARIEGESPALTAGSRLNVHYEELNKRLRQPAVVLEIIADGTGARLVRFRVDGAPTTVETRRCHRVVAGPTGVSATLAGECGADIVDLSTTGFSCLAAAPHEIGAHVAVTLHHADRAYTAAAIIRSIRFAEDGRYWYGLECTQERATAELYKGLQVACMAIQRGRFRSRAAG